MGVGQISEKAKASFLSGLGAGLRRFYRQRIAHRFQHTGHAKQLCVHRQPGLVTIQNGVFFRIASEEVGKQKEQIGAIVERFRRASGMGQGQDRHEVML